MDLCEVIDIKQELELKKMEEFLQTPIGQAYELLTNITKFADPNYLSDYEYKKFSECLYECIRWFGKNG